MKRNEFIKLGLVLPAMATVSDRSAAVEEFVRAGHNDLEKVMQLLQEDPSLINASHHWGNNDYETALDGASHVGNTRIAGFLLQNGARPSLLTLAMMGMDEMVKNWVEENPKSLYMRGPHGFSLLHHARVGQKADLEKWLMNSGLTTPKFS